MKKITEEIEFLEKENRDLTDKLNSIEFQNSAKENDSSAELHLESLEDLELKEIEKITKLQNEIEEIEKQIENSNCELNKNLENNNGRKNQTCGRNSEVKENKQLSNADATLHLSKQKCSTLDSQNANLRTQIKASRKQIRLLAQNLEKMESELASKRAYFARICTETTHAQDFRQENYNRTRSLKERGNKILDSLENEKKALIRAIDSEKKLKKYLEDKMRERTGQESVEGAIIGGKEDEKKSELSTEQVIFEDWRIFENKINSRESFKDVKWQEKLPTMLKKLTSKENLNFNLFNKINRLTSELENIKHAKESMKLEIDGIEAEMNENQTLVNKEISCLEEKINSLTEDNESVKEQLKELNDLENCLNKTLLMLCRQADSVLNTENTKLFMKKLYRKNSVDESEKDSEKDEFDNTLLFCLVEYNLRNICQIMKRNDVSNTKSKVQENSVRPSSSKDLKKNKSIKRAVTAAQIALKAQYFKPSTTESDDKFKEIV
ncbi:MAG: Coiled-coil domain-containing protein 63 [Paramarteilia canceri]